MEGRGGDSDTLGPNLTPIFSLKQRRGTQPVAVDDAGAAVVPGDLQFPWPHPAPRLRHLALHGRPLQQPRHWHQLPLRYEPLRALALKDGILGIRDGTWLQGKLIVILVS